MGYNVYKTCRVCGKQFLIDLHNNIKHQKSCSKECSKIWEKKQIKEAYEKNREKILLKAKLYYSNNKEKCKKNSNSWINKNKDRVKVYKIIYNNRWRLPIQKYKSEKGCLFCGEKTAVCLDLHHLYGKTNAISTMVKNRAPLEEINLEISKCVVLCSNCHRKVHEGILTIPKPDL